MEPQRATIARCERCGYSAVSEWFKDGLCSGCRDTTPIKTTQAPTLQAFLIKVSERTFESKARAAVAKAWRDKMRAEGRCIRCGKAKENAYAQCDDCLSKNKTKHRVPRRPRWSSSPVIRPLLQDDTL